MRIAFVSPEFVTETYFSGGLANYVHRVSRALVGLGHEVHVIVRSREEPSEFVYEGVQVHRYDVGALHRGLNWLTRSRLRVTVTWLDLSLQAYRRLRQLHQQKPLDIVQLPNLNACGLVISLLRPVPYVVRVSSYRPAWNELGGIHRNLDVRAQEWLERSQLHLSRHIYAPSHAVRRLLVERAKMGNVRIIRTPIYLEAEDWDSSIYDKYLKDKRYLLFFGRFELHKGFHTLAQALPQVFQVHPDCHAAFVGWDRPTSLARRMEEYVRSLCGEYSDRLFFIDRTPHKQLYPIIAGAELAVLPSLIDNLPNACLEAMAVGVPVIGTIGTSFDEVITDEETGFLVPAGDVDALAAKINEAWAHPRLREIGQAARCKVREFAPERVVQELLAYFEDVLSGKES